MAKVQLKDVVLARSGDKGDTCDISVFAPNEAVYEHLKRVLTPEVVKAHFGPWVQGEVECFEVPNVLALKFLCHGALGGGASSSLRLDNLGKCFGSNLMRLEIDLPDHLLNQLHAGGEDR
ncbi:MAG: hypothetical protein BAA04_05890 [Firmicutes bacterium ZCTH02-B6]|nr:MAG: hypothetical protein BAA04_05890 [Firmicutes bacterium ZCTH02-B6]